ncbi:MAG: T9SS C-terminal target domain-containing protein [Calditrichaeota bacterium]|nr:MAG: T9SS C-terminal target domain-containing protein [Calditrichota bacterium]
MQIYQIQKYSRKAKFMQNINSVLTGILAVLTICSANLESFGQIKYTENDGSILLPEQKSKIAISYQKQNELSQNSEWQKFTRKNGNWTVQWNEATETPHRAFGESIQIEGFPSINQRNVQEASMTFLKNNASLLKINFDELKFVRANEVNNRWYVSYVQEKDGVKVLFSEVELRIFSNGKVMAFGSDFHSKINVLLSPEISFESAKQTALQDLNFISGTDKVSGGNLFVLPVKNGSEINYHLVHEVEVKIATPVGNFRVYVDAHTNKIIWRHNKVRHNVSGSVSADVQLTLPSDPFTNTNLFDQFVNIGGNQTTTDSLGAFSDSISAQVNLSANLIGPFVNVNREDANDALIDTLVNVGDTIDLHWDSSNSHDAERDAFYHTNFVHKFVTDLDTSFTNANYSMPCNVNINDQCNAFWDGNSINFFLAGGGCPNTAQMPSVVYHEYGHGVNDKLYEQAGVPGGVINGAVHEGLADVLSVAIEDDSHIGNGFFGVGSFLRDLDNNKVYPTDITGEVHDDGEIIGAAFWDLRQATSLQTMSELSHFAKWGTPDDLNTGIAFSEWYLEVLIADDDDGDLSNGTPNFTEINNSFNAHGIGSSLYISATFAHTPFLDTQNTTMPYTLSFNLGGSGFNEPDSVRVHYSIDNFQTTQSVSATNSISNIYQADIPPQSAGSIVKYYFSFFDPLSNSTSTVPINAPQENYAFLVGFQSIDLEPFEGTVNWQVGDPSDNATQGIWEVGDPDYYNLAAFGASFYTCQPEDDHTSIGVNCFVTGAAGNSFNPLDGLANGKTTLFSPVYDFTTVTDPVIIFYRWFATISANSGDEGSWNVDISNDNGQTWINIENTDETSNEWVQVKFKVEDFVQPTSTVQLRFVADNPFAATPTLVEALVDDFEILGTGGFVGIEEIEPLQNVPKKFVLHQNFPNPFNPETEIRYSTPKSNVLLEVFNILGQRVITLVNESQNSGNYSVTWYGKDSFGNPVSSGVYFLKLSAANKTFTKKILLLK